MFITPQVRSNAAVGITGIFVVLWLYAGGVKLLDHATFAVQVAQSPLLTPIAGAVSWCIPVLEMMIATLLVVRRTRRAGLYLSFVMMVMFTAYLFVMTRFSEHVPCSCGGILQAMTWEQHLVFNAMMSLLAATGIVFNHSTYLLQQSRGIRKPVEKSRNFFHG